MVNRELLDKFKHLYQNKFNVTLTDEEATKMATDLLNLMKILVKPVPKQVNDEKHLENEGQNENCRI